MKLLENSPAILLTGASSGLGAEYARQLHRSDPRTLLLVARRTERLEALAAELGERVQVFTSDLRDRQSRESLIASIRERGFRVELLINNAGYGSLGPFAASDQQWELEMIELNCKAPVHLTRALLPELLACGKGAIINVCSTAAFQPMPYMATYGSTKSFLHNFSTALAAECGPKLQVIAHCPGPTKSEFHLVVGLAEKLAFIPSAETAPVVAAALRRLKSGRSGTVVTGRLNLFFSQLNRLFPRWFAARLVAVVLRDAHR